MKQFEHNTVFKLQPQNLFEKISLYSHPLEANGTSQAGTFAAGSKFKQFQFPIQFPIQKHPIYDAVSFI